MQNELTELKKQVQVLKKTVFGFECLLIAGVALAATIAQTVLDVIQTKSFEAVNDEGSVVVKRKVAELGGWIGILNNDMEVVTRFGAIEHEGELH